MKIRPDEIQVPEENQQKRTRTMESTDAFQEMLAKEVNRQADKGISAAAGPPPLTAPLLEVTQPVAQPEAEREIMDNVESLLNDWENYAQQLETRGEETSLKEAYSMLENIADQVNRLKQSEPDLAESNPRLKSLVDELEVLTVTETIKFNRGDYI